jgi:hypothetical protein
MANRAIDKPNCYAKWIGSRAWIAFKANGSPWRGLALDFEKGSRAFVPSSAVRSKTTGRKWVDANAVKRDRRNDFSTIE